MELRTSSPWWLAGLLLLGLISLFMGERAFSHVAIANQLSLLGYALITSSLVVRGWVISRTSGSQRRIELILAVCHLGIVLSLIGYWLSSSSGMAFLGIEGEGASERWQDAGRVLWLIVLLCSLLPLLLIEAALGLEGRISFRPGPLGQGASVIVWRVREVASSGLSIALAAAFLMATCNVANQRNMRKDVSYFKTSSAGSATENMVRSLAEPLQVLLFFPETSEVTAEVETYVRSLREATQNLEYELHDRLLDSALAEKYSVRGDGAVVLVRGEKSEKIKINPDIAVARKRSLRDLDSAFQKALMHVIRDTKVAYFTVGHGELNDPDSAGSLSLSSPLQKSTLIKKLLKQLNYKVTNYQGYGKPIPEDCSLLFVLAPRAALMDEELRAIDDYLASGGAAIITMDPKSKMRLGLLSQRLGVSFNPIPLADDKKFMVQNRGVTDHSLLVTNQFLSHASIPTVSRGSANSAILFLGPGSFDDAPLGPSSTDTKISKVIRSMKSSFRDRGSLSSPRNFLFDKKTEKRDRYSLVVAVEGREDEGKKEMRVALVADAEILSDGVLARVAVVQTLLVDLIKWGGGEEEYAGETNSEKDKRIEHTKSQDAVWFYGTIVGAPLLMLMFGLFFVRRKRRSGVALRGEVQS